eukprot:UN01778
MIYKMRNLVVRLFWRRHISLSRKKIWRKKSVDGVDEVQKAPDNTPAGGGLLFVVVHEAQDLEGKHHTNPYAKIIFKGEEKKTKVIKKNRP